MNIFIIIFAPGPIKIAYSPSFTDKVPDALASRKQTAKSEMFTPEVIR